MTNSKLSSLGYKKLCTYRVCKIRRFEMIAILHKNNPLYDTAIRQSNGARFFKLAETQMLVAVGNIIDAMMGKGRPRKQS